MCVCVCVCVLARFYVLFLLCDFFVLVAVFVSLEGNACFNYFIIAAVMSVTDTEIMIFYY